MTKKEYIFWLLSSIFLMIGLIFLFIPSHSIQNYSFPFLIIGLLLVFFIKDKNAPKKPVAKKFYQKKIFSGMDFHSVNSGYFYLFHYFEKRVTL